MQTTEKLAVFRQLVACAHSIPFSEYDARTFEVIAPKGGDDALFFLLSMDTGADFCWTPEGPDYAFLHPENGFRPIICTNSLGMVWIAEIESMDSVPYRIHTMGPVFFSDWSIHAIRDRLDAFRLSDAVRNDVLSFLAEIPVVPTIRFYEYALMLHWCLTDEHITISDLTYQNAGTAAAKAAEQPGRDPHGTYLAEQRMLRSVREGNLQYRKEMDRMASVGLTGQIVAGENLRHMKNYVIIYTALCCRAAVEGGLDVETAYTLSDEYLQSVESARDLAALHETSNAMVQDYIQRVHRNRHSDALSSQIRKACEWIRLSPELYTIGILAEKLGYTDYYFSKKFKKEVGISVKEYILKQKLRASAELLQTTSLPVAEIAERLGIESQSYFAAKFREETGQTPSEYRDMGSLQKHAEKTVD